ncbi:hypothetical protein PCANC_16392 [Puccinia coronata f. sp. avenae]|uniref:Uncharacterized protein n=1 Tax=Puccinia coronata f. sp. avenae TaxID=200324 RepID=A0A2N5SYH5_9BASI|nr:hypothetical protein PCANC_16392 [Puccinia coronata f. sp. avenae]
MNWMGTSRNYRSGLPLNQTFCPIRTRIPINHSAQKEAEEQEEETPLSMVLTVVNIEDGHHIALDTSGTRLSTCLTTIVCSRHAQAGAHNSHFFQVHSPDYGNILPVLTGQIFMAPDSVLRLSRQCTKDIWVPFGTLIRVPSGTLIRVPFGTLIRVPSGTLTRVPFGTLIRVPSGTLIRSWVQREPSYYNPPSQDLPASSSKSNSNIDIIEPQEGLGLDTNFTELTRPDP